MKSLATSHYLNKRRSHTVHVLWCLSNYCWTDTISMMFDISMVKCENSEYTLAHARMWRVFNIYMQTIEETWPFQKQTFSCQTVCTSDVRANIKRKWVFRFSRAKSHEFGRRIPAQSKLDRRKVWIRFIQI